MKHALTVTLSAALALGAFAGDVNIKLWRGETATKILHDYARVGDAPDGFEVKVGTAHEVRYLTRPFGTHYESFADRVEWGSKKPGVKVLSVAAPADAKPGVYRAGDVKITVIDRVLPPSGEWKYFLDLWQHPWAVSRYFGVKPFSPEHYAKMRPLWRMLAGAGQKTLTVTLLDKPWDNQCYDAYGTMIRHIKTKDGKWRFDYSVFDEYVAFGRECGLGPVISCYTMCPWGYMATWEEEDGTVRKAKAVPGTKEFRSYWGDFLADFAAHLKAKGWFEDAVVSIDERSPDDVRNIAALIAEKAPGLKIAIAGNRSPSQFEGIDIHHACFGLYHLTDKLIAEAKERGERGKVTTYYVCCSPDHPNTLCHNELEEAFWLGAYPAFAGLDGFLRWAWNSWPEDPMHDASYTGIGSGWKAGDTYLVYPDGSPSLRFLELRSGIVAAEKVRILKEEGLFADEIAAAIESRCFPSNCDFPHFCVCHRLDVSYFLAVKHGLYHPAEEAVADGEHFLPAVGAPKIVDENLCPCFHGFHALGIIWNDDAGHSVGHHPGGRTPSPFSQERCGDEVREFWDAVLDDVVGVGTPFQVARQDDVHLQFPDLAACIL